MLESIEDQDYAQLLKDQLEVYLQRIELFAKDKANVRYMWEEELRSAEKSVKELHKTLGILKEDRTKDQVGIFELERKIGLLQVHYTYDRAKLMSNAEVAEEYSAEEEIRKKAENLIDRLNQIVKQIPE